MPTMSPTSQSVPRFELPVLDLNFGNITDGTNIPPPPESPLPRVHTPPITPIADKEQEPVKADASGDVPSSAEPPLSPAPSNRQGSLRRFLSRSKLNGDFSEGNIPASQTEPNFTTERPQSRGGFSLMGERTTKRPGGWFRRFSRSGDQPTKRRSSFFLGGGTTSSPAKSSGPPPPMIPELAELEKDKGSLGGDDIFKNIK